MSGIEEIDVHIDDRGRVRIEVRGVVGKACEALTRDLERQLGDVVVEREYRDSYHQAAETQTDHQDERA